MNFTMGGQTKFQQKSTNYLTSKQSQKVLLVQGLFGTYCHL